MFYLSRLSSSSRSAPAPSSSWTATGLAALGVAGLLYTLRALLGDSPPKTFDVCVGDLSDGTEVWFENVL
ncbi:MAG: hypothetical protein ACR2GR_10570 [Rhodothermales bacterium]